MLSCVWLFVIPWTAAHQASLSFSNSWSLLKRMSTEYDAIQPSYPLSPPSPSALNLSQYQGLSQWVAFFASGGQSIGASASASVLPMNIQGWFPLGLTGLISLKSKGLSRVFSNTTVQKHWFFPHCLLYGLSHLYRTTRKSIALTVWPLSAKWCLCFLICCLRVLQLFF